MTKDMPDAELIEAFQRKDRRALSRLLTHAAQGTLPQGALTSGERTLRGRVIAFSGGGGVGKSSLIGKLAEVIRRQGKSAAILCCDPESPVTGGALLGDRVRIARGEDPDLFIRSLATPGGHQAAAAHLDIMTALLLDYGFDVVILETVGAGQGDTAVRSLADCLVVLQQPESGDSLQWEKAGLLEVADVVVIHKSDLPGADRTLAELNELLNLPGCRPIPVLKASAATGQGIDELWRAIEESMSSDGAQVNS